MSGSRRQRDTLAPSLFPFLAVLLCTMGSLVLILMLIVAGAQSSAKEIVAESQNQIEEAQGLLAHAKHAFTKQLAEGRVSLEKKRLVLQHLEEHIQELLTELDELKRTAELVDAEQSQDQRQEEDLQATISELEKQLTEATRELKQKLEKPDGDKPIFAIIPYQGSKGTHRRPIYLECTSEGVIIQPEGISVPISDLRPPYGPGNPLDAALRTVRAEFPPSNGAVTSTAYPLLVVRPSGIRTYALARAAMSGWDDQFGYELVNEDLELAYPQSVAGLSDKLNKALELARERQAALVMAMPNKYRQSGNDQYPELDEIGDDWGGAGNSGRLSGRGSAGQSQRGTAAGARGGFAFSEDAVSSLSGDRNSATGAGTGAGFGTAEDGSQAPPSSSRNLSEYARGGGLLGGAGEPRQDGRGQDQNAAQRWNADSGQGAAADRFFGGGLLSGEDNHSHSDGGADYASSVAAGNSSNGKSSTGSPGGGSAGGAAAQANQSGQQFQMPFASPGSSSNSSSGSAGAQSQPTDPNATAGASGSASSSAESSQQAGGIPQISMNMNRGPAKQEKASAVARTRGRDWAWSQGPPTQTPVVRSIRMQCLEDRWLVLPDSGSSAAATIIAFDVPPRERAEQLARVVLDRVDSWGLALMSGYWKPILVVDVAADAEWRFDQLQQLLDGSGLEVQRRSASGSQGSQ